MKAISNVIKQILLKKHTCFENVEFDEILALLTHLWVKSGMKVSDFLLVMPDFQCLLACLEVEYSNLNIQA